MGENQSHQNGRWIVALVHGIGTTDKLDMIHDVNEALKATGRVGDLQPGAEITEVHEPPGPRPRYNIVRSGRLVNGEPLRIGTAHWADITYYRRGLLNLIGALMMTAFGVRFFAEVAALARPNAAWPVRALAWVQRRVLKLLVQIVALVVFPVTFVALIFSTMGLIGFSIVHQKSILMPAQHKIIAVLAVLACLGAAGIGLYRSLEFRKERPLAIWIFGAIAMIAVVVGASMFLGNRIWISTAGDDGMKITWQTREMAQLLSSSLPLPMQLREWMVRLAEFFGNQTLADRIKIVNGTAAYFALMHAVQLVAGILLLCLTLIAAVNLLFLTLVAKLFKESSKTFVFATVSAVTVWIINLVLLWPENFTTFAAMATFLDGDQKGATIRINTIDWTTLRFDLLSFSLADPIEKRPGFMAGRTYYDTYPLMWFEALFLVFLAATLVLVIVVMFARRIWCFWHRHTDVTWFAAVPSTNRPRKVNWPRLIVSRGYVALVLILIWVVPGILFALALNATALGRSVPALQWISERVPMDFSVGAGWARTLLIAFLLSFVLFAHVISDGAKLVLDLVNHFTPRGGWRGYFRRRSGVTEFPVRERIQCRFDEMIEALLMGEERPNLVIIAHSQGTIITLDALLRSEWRSSILSRIASLTVLTFGSPLTHVYEEYFPQQYGAGSDIKKSLEDLKNSGNVKWFNVYRIDDYVGTYVETSIKDFPVNFPVTQGGHTNYWKEEVFKPLFLHSGMDAVLKPATAAGLPQPVEPTA